MDDNVSQIIKRLKKKLDFQTAYAGLGTRLCDGGCGGKVYGILAKPMYCYECGPSQKEKGPVS